MKYLFPCECGKNIAIDVGQAGQMLTCRCGQQIELPGMRDIRRLPPAPDSRAQISSWSRAQGVKFALGASIAAVSLIVAMVIWGLRSTLETEKPPPMDITAFLDEIDIQEADVILQEWNAANQVGLGAWSAPQYLIDREFAATLMAWIVGALIVAGIATAVSLSSLINRPKPRSGRPPPRGPVP